MLVKTSAFVALVSHLAVFLPIAAQTAIQLDERPSCSTCTPDLRPIVTLGSSDDPGGFGPLVQIAINSRN